MSFLIVLALGGLMHAASSFILKRGDTPAATALSFGFLVLTAFFMGRAFKAIKLPKLTGYIATGIVAGPQVLGLITHDVAVNLDIFKGVAVALISISGGLEMEFKALRPLMRSIVWVSIIGIFGTMLLLTAAGFLARDLLPFMAPMSAGQVLAVSLALSAVMVAQSPAVVMAIRNELNADGPTTKTALGIVIIADLFVILMFALASTLAKSVLGGDVSIIETVKHLAWELLGSIVAGGLIGLILAVYFWKVKGAGGLFVMAVCFIVAEVGKRMALDPVLLSLVAGMVARNATKQGDALQHSIEGTSLPIYIVFFAIAGAGIHLDALPKVWAPALIFVLVRALGFLGGSRIGTKIAGAPSEVRRFAGFGMLPQAGLAIALALLFASTFGKQCQDADTLLLSIVAINEIIAPAVLRFALMRSGEAGKAVGAAHGHGDAPAATTPAPVPVAATTPLAGTPPPTGVVWAPQSMEASPLSEYPPDSLDGRPGGAIDEETQG